MSDDERALLMAVPLRHLEATQDVTGPLRLPAGRAGHLDEATPGMPVIVMATEAGDDAVPAATWRARFVRRVPYDVGTPWPDGLPSTWTDEHPVAEPPQHQPTPQTDEDGGDEEPEEEEDDYYPDEDEDDEHPQSFLEVEGLEQLPREEWLFANELVGKQARGGRSFHPRAPTIVDLPD